MLYVSVLSVLNPVKCTPILHLLRTRLVPLPHFKDLGTCQKLVGGEGVEIVNGVTEI